MPPRKILSIENIRQPFISIDTVVWNASSFWHLYTQRQPFPILFIVLLQGFNFISEFGNVLVEFMKKFIWARYKIL